MRPNGQSQYPPQQGYSTLPRHMQDVQHSGSATLPRSFRTGSPARSGSPMTGRSSSPVVREIPIQHIQSSNQSQNSSGHHVPPNGGHPPPQSSNQGPPGSFRPAPQGHQAGPYGYTIYTGNPPQGGTPPPGQPAYPSQQPPPFSQSQATSTASATAHAGYPQTSAYASAHAGYPPQGSYPETTWTATQQSTQPMSQTSVNTQSTQSTQHSTSPPQTSVPSHETISQEPKLRQIPVSHQTSQQQQEQAPQGNSQNERTATTGSSRQSPESTGAQSQNESGNGTSTPKKKPSTPMEQIEEVINNVKEYSVRVNQFQGTKKDKEYKLLEEMLTRNLLKLDCVEAGCDDNVRQKRKQTVKDIQAYLDQLELKAFSQEQSCDTESRKEEEMQTENDKNNELSKPGNISTEKSETMDTSDENDIPRKSVKEMIEKAEHAKC